MSEPEEVEVELVENVVDPIVDETMALAPIGADNAAAGAPITTSLQNLISMGLVVPIATPEDIRAAFSIQQKLIANILDEHDYLYVVPYTADGNKPRRYITTDRSSAIQFAKGYELPVSAIRAAPKKSGIQKLAAALGISARRVMSGGLPNEPASDYAWVEYEARHDKTGRTASGMGFCNAKERSGTAHEVIATADTRGYNRSVLRLAGFGDTSADDIVGTAPPQNLQITSDSSELKDAPPRPALSENRVMTAARIWAEEICRRPAGERFQEFNGQVEDRWRLFRARARRGDFAAAKHLGKMGISWEGEAQDTAAHQVFQVEKSPVAWEAIMPGVQAQNAPAPAATTSAAPADAPMAQPGTASVSDVKQAAVPAQGLVISKAQAQKLSEKLLAKLGDDKDKCRGWLKEKFNVGSSKDVPTSVYENVMAAIDAIP